MDGQLGLNKVSEWTIFIDNTDGKLAMNKNGQQTDGRDIEVVAKEEIMPIVDSLKEENAKLTHKFELACAMFVDLSKKLDNHPSKQSRDCGIKVVLN